MDYVLSIGWGLIQEKGEAACLKSLQGLTQRGNYIAEVGSGLAACCVWEVGCWRL